ncbi:MAG TPA: AMP-binding protein [Thermohalobaculum sp.]|nr:AMP-binding protein [Thermohalobaculum sp.]
MGDHYDALETREPGEREEVQFEQLRSLLAWAPDQARGLAQHLDGIDAGAIGDRAALARLPVLRKDDLIERQRADPPFGGLTTRPPADFSNLFQSPGPIYEPGRTDIADWWRFARALHAARIRETDFVLNAFAYHLTPAGHMLESGIRALGATVLAGGVGNTEAQVAAAAHVGVTAYVGTPDFLNVMLEKAEEIGADLRSIDRAFVSGGPLFPALREGYAARGISCLQGYGTADLGLIAYETMGESGPNPGMVVDEGVIVEIVRPGTGDPVPDGEVGEVLVTALNEDYPLIRFATGDMSAVIPDPSPCGRTAMRIKGWMGRADQTTKVRGMFVRPGQIADALRRHPEIGHARLVISREGGTDRMVLKAEADTTDPALAKAVEATLRDVLKLRAEVELVEVDSLPRDGRVIDDTRKFD